MKIKKIFESGFIDKHGYSVKYFAVTGKKYKNYFTMTQRIEIAIKEIKRITLALDRLELHEKRKNILDGVQKNLDEKPLNNKTKRKI